MKINRMFTVIIIGVLMFLQYNFLGSFILSIDFLLGLVTFLSIMFGFYITSFSIFSTSSFVKGLYKQEDSKSGKTLLHTLIAEYKAGLLLNLFSIIYFLILIFYITQDKDFIFLNLSEFITYLAPSLLLFNIIYSFRMLSNLIRIITQESKV